MKEKLKFALLWMGSPMAMLIWCGLNLGCAINAAATGNWLSVIHGGLVIWCYKSGMRMLGDVMGLAEMRGRITMLDEVLELLESPDKRAAKVEALRDSLGQ